MSESEVTREGQRGLRPGREAPVDDRTRRRRGRRGRRGEQPMVPEAEFRSYYGMPVLNKPVWEPRDIAGYLFLGGLAGASSVVAGLADVRGQRELARAAKVGAAGAGVLSLAALVHDLGKPSRFLNMLRVVKVTSPMSIGSWVLSAYVPAALVAAGSEVTGRLRPVGALGTTAAAGLGPAVASYTAALISNTAVPAWHDGYREMPFIFVGSGAMAAGGLGLLAAPVGQHGLPRRAALAGSVCELVAAKTMEHRIGMVSEPYHEGKAGKLMRAGQALSVLGNALAVVGRGRRLPTSLGGAALIASSACTRFGIFFAGVASSEDPRFTVQPQRERLEARHGR